MRNQVRPKDINLGSKHKHTDNIKSQATEWKSPYHFENLNLKNRIKELEELEDNSFKDKFQSLEDRVFNLINEVEELKVKVSSMSKKDINNLINAKLPKATGEDKLLIFKTLLEDNIKLRKEIESL